MMRIHSRIVLALLCGALVLAGCESESDDSVAAGSPKGEKTSVYFPVIDGLSSASILRVSESEFGYIARTGGGAFKLNTVNVNTRNKQLTSPDLDSNVAIHTAANGKIALIVADETGYEGFIAHSLKVFDAKTLTELKSFDFNPLPENEGHEMEPLHHRDAGLSLGDKYLAVVSADDEIVVAGTAVQYYISIYDVVGSASAVHVRAFVDSSGAKVANPDLGAIGTPIFVSTWGDYLIAGGSPGGTAVFKINKAEGALSLEVVTAADAAAPHWAISNDRYALESKASVGDVKVWKWNGADKPTAVGTADTGASGNIQAYSFAYDDADTAYVFGGQSRKLYKVNLTTAAATEICDLTTYETTTVRGANTTVVTFTTGALWTVEHRKSGTDDYFVLSGTTSSSQSTVVNGGTPTPSTTAQNGVLVLKNPTTATVLDATALVSTATDTTYTSAVRTMKTFVNSDGDIYYAAKNYTTNPLWYATPYVLQLRKIN